MGCNDTPKTERFVSYTNKKEIVMHDKTAHLDWTNGRVDRTAQSGCKPIKPVRTADEINMIADEYCSKLDFASHNDWRVPTAKENQTFVIEMEKEGKQPYYLIPKCPRIIGVDKDKVTTTNTHNSSPLGHINSWDKNKGAGIRCIRDVK
jgi:hypothetical protein